jgi:hypothetical protein
MIGVKRHDAKARTWEECFEPGERLLWEGAPAPGINAHPLAIFGTAFGVPFAYGGVTMLDIARIEMFGPDGSLLFGLFVLPVGLAMTVVGLGIMAAPWVAGPLYHRRVRYALSDRRAYIARDFWLYRDLKSYPITPETELIVHEGKVQTILFAKQVSRAREGGTRTIHIGFRNLADGEQVHSLMQGIRQAATDG